MEKKDAWVALFSQKPKKGTDFKLARSVIGADIEPDADVDAALDPVTRDRIGDFNMDRNAFIQANASDERKPEWMQMVPASTAAPAAKPKAAAKAKPVAASTAASVPTAAPAPAQSVAPVALPARKVGLSPNALGRAARAVTAPAAAPTLSLGNVPPPAVTPAVNLAPAPASAPVRVPRIRRTVQTMPRPRARQSVPAATIGSLPSTVPVAAPAPVPVQTIRLLIEQSPPRRARQSAPAPATTPAPATAPVATPAAVQTLPPVHAAVTSTGSSSKGSTWFIVISCICFIVCLFAFKWLIYDTLMYADLSAKAGLHEKP